jgi:hypothetical protein
MSKKYCNISQIKDWAIEMAYQDLGFDEESKYDIFVESLIDRASRFIDRQCNVPDDFFSGGCTVTEYQDGQAESSTLDYPDTERSIRFGLTQRTYRFGYVPVISVTTIHKNIAGIGEADSWTQITKYRANNSTGRLIISSAQSPLEGTDNLRLIYKAGYSTLPEDIRFACEELVGNMLRAMVQHKMAAKVRFVQPKLVSFSSPEVFTDSVKEKLAIYRQRRM